MKKLKRRLLPVLTCLIAAAAILLPPHISQARDTQLMDGVHTETLAGDRLSLQETTLGQRIELLHLWMTNDKISALTQPISESELNTDILPVAETALNDLLQGVATMANVIPGMPEITTGSRLFLRDTTSGLNASMILLQGGQRSGDEFAVELIVDEQTGLVLSFTWEIRLMPEGYVLGTYDYATCAREYLNYIGMDGELVMSVMPGVEARYDLSGCGVTYTFINDGQTISIRPYEGAAD